MGMSGFRSLRFSLIVYLPVLITIILVEFFRFDPHGVETLAVVGIGGALSLILAFWIYGRALVATGATSSRRSERLSGQKSLREKEHG
jgi:hypothetical protein